MFILFDAVVIIIYTALADFMTSQKSSVKLSKQHVANNQDTPVKGNKWGWNVLNVMLSSIFL